MKRLTWGWGLIVAGALSALLTGCSGSEGEPRKAAAERTMLLGASDVARVTRTDLATGVQVSGTLEPSIDVRITAPIADLIEIVTVKEGQHVQAGEVLARFRSSALEPAAASAEAQRTIAESDYQRMQNLLKEGAASPRDVENAEAALRAAEAAAAGARKRLDEATVRASVSGEIAERVVQSGDRVSDGDPMFRLVNTSELEFQASVPSEYAGRVRPGVPVELSVTGMRAASIRGTVARVNATVDAATRQIKIYVNVPNHDRRLVGDLFATGRVVLEAAPQALAIPAAAIRREGTGASFAWIVVNGRIERREVVTGLSDESRNLIEVRKGLASGETAVVGPIEGLHAGQPVELAAGGS
jgi:RND family efflux transporter MFP subunit